MTEKFNGLIEVQAQANVFKVVGETIDCLEQCGVDLRTRQSTMNQMCGLIQKIQIEKWIRICKTLKSIVESRCNIEVRLTFPDGREVK